MLDIKFVRENPEVVKENIRKKFQDHKLPMVDEVLELDKENRAIKQEVEALRAERNKLSKQIGGLMAKGEKEEAEKVKAVIAADAARTEELTAKEKEEISTASQASGNRFRFPLSWVKKVKRMHNSRTGRI